MSVDSNKAAVRGYFEALNRDQSMNVLGQVAAPGYRAHFPGAEMDLEGTKAFGNGFFAAFPGLRHDLDEVFGEGDWVSVRMVLSGKHTQPFHTPAGVIPPTGAEIRLDVINHLRFAGDKVEEQWSVFDMLGFMQSLGIVPS